MLLLNERSSLVLSPELKPSVIRFLGPRGGGGADVLSIRFLVETGHGCRHRQPVWWNCGASESRSDLVEATKYADNHCARTEAEVAWMSPVEVGETVGETADVPPLCWIIPRHKTLDNREHFIKV